MATGTTSPGRAKIGARTLRTDRWWQAPLLTFLGLAGFLVYGFVRIFHDSDYWVEAYHYIAPFYSPCLSESCVPGSSHFLGQPFPQLPSWMSPAMIVLILPAGFRATCYYYRKAYYRSFWASPQACAVAEPHGKYTGETRFPLIVQNLHRYFWIAAGVISVINTWDVIQAFRPEGHAFGFGLGTIIMLINVVLLWAYTLSCHSCRHIVGGRLRNFSKHPLRYKAWGLVSKLNGRHMQFAWASLFSVAFADFYVLLLATDTINDLRFF